MNHLKNWLVFRGDTLHGIHTLKDAQVRYVHEFPAIAASPARLHKTKLSNYIYLIYMFRLKICTHALLCHYYII